MGLIFPAGLGPDPSPTFGLAGVPAGPGVPAGFDQSGIVVRTDWLPAQGEVVLSWTSPAPAGTTFQVYWGGVLAWHGTARTATFPWPSGDVLVQVGTVGPGQGAIPQGPSPPPGYDTHAAIGWGYDEPSGDAASFHVYGSPSAGAPVDYSRPLATVPAYAGGVGAPVAGRASRYSKTFGPLKSGAWTFGVRSVDAAGNEGPTREVQVPIVAAPAPPAADPQGDRLQVHYDPTTRVATLAWRPSPG